MNFRMTGILFGIVLAFALVLLGLSLYEGDSTGSEVIFSRLVKAGVRADDIDTVELEKGDGNKIKFVRTGTDWTIDSPIKVKAESAQITRLVEELFRARPIPFPDLTSSKAAHGLEPPGLKVTVRKGNEHSATVNIGEVSGGGRTSVAFITTDDRPDRPIAIPRDAIDPLLRDGRSNGNVKDLAKWTNDYRSRQVFSVNPQLAGDEVTAVTLAGKGDDLTVTKKPEGWRLTANYKAKVNQGGKEATEPRKLDNVDADPVGDTTSGPNTFNGIIPLVRSLTSLQAISGDDFLSDEPAKLVEYGLADSNPDRIKVELKFKGVGNQPERTEVAFIGKKVEGPQAAPNRVYVKVQGVPGVIRATGTNTDGIAGVLADPGPLRNRNLLPSDVDRHRIAAIDLVSKDLRMTKLRQVPGSPGKWALYGEANDPTDANATTINKMLDVLFQPRTVKDFPAPNDANMIGLEYRTEVRLWTEMEPTPVPTDPKAIGPDPKIEPRTKGEPVKLTFGKVVTNAAGKREVYVRRTLSNGTYADFIVPVEIRTSSTPPPMGGFPPPAPTGTETDVLATITKSRIDLLDPTLKSFSTSAVAKVTIAGGRTGGNPLTLQADFEDKPEPGATFSAGKWTYTQYPAGQPDRKEPPRPADAGEASLMLSSLARLTAGPFVSERRDDAMWAANGLNPTSPRMKVTVTLKGGVPPTPPPSLPGQPPPAVPPVAPPEERIYYFGNDTSKDGRNYVYARQEGRDAVFLVDKSIFDDIAATDLRDRTVVQFDLAKVRKITLVGWQEKTKQVNAVVIEKSKDGNWAYTPVPTGSTLFNMKVTSPPLTLDPIKVNTFLGVLKGLRAEKPGGFLAGGQRPEYGFAPYDKGLIVLLEMEGGAPSVQLNIAAGVTTNEKGDITGYVPPEQAGRFVVWVDTAADPSVNPITVAGPPLRPFKEGPGGFGR